MLQLIINIATLKFKQLCITSQKGFLTQQTKANTDDFHVSATRKLYSVIKASVFGNSHSFLPKTDRINPAHVMVVSNASVNKTNLMLINKNYFTNLNEVKWLVDATFPQPPDVLPSITRFHN